MDNVTEEICKLGRRFAAVAVRTRHERLWLAMVAIPLTVIAVTLAGDWFLLPVLAALAWCWSPQDTLYGWIAAMWMGVVGTVWALWGVLTLPVTFHHPLATLAIGAAWAASMALLAAAAAALHRRYGRGY